MTVEQMAAAKAAGDRAETRWLADRPHDYAGAVTANVEALAAALLALHGRGRWQ